MARHADTEMTVVRFVLRNQETGGTGFHEGTLLPGEAPGLVEAEEGENLGKRLSCGFHARQLGRSWYES